MIRNDFQFETIFNWVGSFLTAIVSFGLMQIHQSKFEKGEGYEWEVLSTDLEADCSSLKSLLLYSKYEGMMIE